MFKIDVWVFDFLDKFISCDFMDYLMIFFTKITDLGLLWLIPAFILIFYKDKRGYGLLILTSFFTSLILSSVIIKPLVARLRPFIVDTDITLLIPPAIGYSFPSSHTATSFASAMMIYYYNKKLGYLAFIGAFMVGLSRVYLKVHYFSDVIIGGVIGVIVSVIIYKNLKKYYLDKA